MKAPSEMELVRRWQEGDRNAQRHLLRVHYGALVAFARKKGWHEPEDVAQQTVLSVLRSVHRFRGHSSLRTFLFATARNIALASNRQHAREVPEGNMDEQALCKAESGSHDALRASALCDALLTLPGGLRWVLHLSYWET